jgi:hypothetical protein
MVGLQAQEDSLGQWEAWLTEIERHFAAGELEESANQMEQLVGQLGHATRGTVKNAAGLQELYGRLQRAYSKISLEGASLSPLPKLETLIAKESPPAVSSSVSFARDVAPILVEHCQGCHIDGKNGYGGLRLDTVQEMMRGGNSGPIIKARDADASLLIKKLKGQSGQRMPAGGRPPLVEGQIRLIARWINDGAVSDAATETTPIGQVASQAWASSASGDQVREKRRTTAVQRWKTAMGERRFQEASDEDLLVLGDVSQEAAEQLLKEAQEASKMVRKALRIPDQLPILKGGVVLFALPKRYDYGEFGKMTENRTLPADWSGHWRKQSIDAYGVLQCDPVAPMVAHRGMLVHILSSLHVSGMNGVPHWFAEGMGRSTASQLVPKDPRIKPWESRFGLVVRQIKDPKDVLEAKLSEEDLGIFAYGWIRNLSDRKNRKAFDGLLRLLHEGKSFDEAFGSVFAPPSLFLQTWLGLPAKK